MAASKRGVLIHQLMIARHEAFRFSELTLLRSFIQQQKALNLVQEGRASVLLQTAFLNKLVSDPHFCVRSCQQLLGISQQSPPRIDVWAAQLPFLTSMHDGEG